MFVFEESIIDNLIKLDSKKKKIILDRIGLNTPKKSLQQIGDEMDLTKQFISIVEKQILKKFDKKIGILSIQEIEILKNQYIEELRKLAEDINTPVEKLNIKHTNLNEDIVKLLLENQYNTIEDILNSSRLTFSTLPKMSRYSLRQILEKRNKILDNSDNAILNEFIDKAIKLQHYLNIIMPENKINIDINLIKEKLLNSASLQKFIDREDSFKRITIEQLEFDKRTYYTLKRNGISTLYELQNMSINELEELKSVGSYAIEIIIKKIKSVENGTFEIKEKAINVNQNDDEGKTKNIKIKLPEKKDVKKLEPNNIPKKQEYFIDNELLDEKKKEIRIESFEFENRTYMALKRNNINTLGQLVSKSKEELLKLPKIGGYAIRDIEEKIKNINQNERIQEECFERRRIEELNLDYPSYSALKRNNINYVDELIECSEEQLLEMESLGTVKLQHIKQKLEKNNLFFLDSLEGSVEKKKNEKQKKKEKLDLLNQLIKEQDDKSEKIVPIFHSEKEEL